MKSPIQLLRKFAEHKLAFASLVFLIAIHIISISISISPGLIYDPSHIDISKRLQSPSLGENLLGTDAMGRDIFSRILSGIKVTLFIGFTSMTISLLVGLSLGVTAGYFGGWTDTIIMRGIDVLSSFPQFFLIVVIAAITKPTVIALTLIIGFTGWISIALLIRNKTLALKQREFIGAVEALGGGNRRIIFKHIIPNCMPNLIVALTYGVGNSILLECSLSYLTIGVQEPLPSLGNMLFAGKMYLLQGRYLWLSMYSGFTIMVITISYSFLGDGLFALANPHLKKRSRFSSMSTKVGVLNFKKVFYQNRNREPKEKLIPVFADESG